MDNLDNGLELLSGRLVVLFLTYDLALKASANFPAGTKVKVTNDPNPDLNGEYTWDGTKLVKTTNNTLEKAKEEAEKIVNDKIDNTLTKDKILDLISGEITESDLDQNLRQRIDEIESISPIIDKLKKDVKKSKEEVDEKVFFLNVDYQNLKEEVQNIQLQVDLDFQAIQDRIDQIQAEVDAKWLEVDQIRDDLTKEINDRVAAVREETEQRIEDVRKLNDGLTQEIIDRKDGDQKLYENIENYKVSNDDALANVREEVRVAVDTANASAEKVDSMDARVKVAEDNAGTALENSAAAVSKANAASDLASATAGRVDSMQADVVKALDDSGTALTNSATAIEQSQVAVDKANAAAESVTVLESKLNSKNATYRQDTAPTKDTHPNLTEGDLWINPSANNEQKRWNGTDWVDISDVRVGQNATAISELKTSVKEQDDKITAVSEKVTSLEATIGDMATSEALEQLKGTVTEQGDKIDANTEKLVALETTVGKNQEANAKALQDLTTRIEKDEDDIKANTSAITALDSTVNASLNAINITADMNLENDLIYYNSSSQNVVKSISESGTTRRVLTIGDNSSDDMAWMYPKAMLPYDPDVMYKVRAKLRRLSGDGAVYLGLVVKNSDKTQFVTSNNILSDNVSSSSYFADGVIPPLNEWVEYEWYIKGRASSSALLPPTYGGLGNPIQMQNATGYITPVFIANYSGLSGVVELAYMVLERAEAYKVISANANALTSLKTDVQKNTDGIQAMGEAITNVEASITNMDIGGQNHWTIWPIEPTQSDADNPYLSVQWLTESQEWIRTTLTKDVNSYHHSFDGLLIDLSYPIVIGELYTLTFEMRASKAITIAATTINFGTNVTYTDNSLTTDTEWKTYTITFPTKGTLTSKANQAFGLTLLKGHGWTTNDWYELRRIQMQKGNKATRYQKAQAGLVEGIKANSQAFNGLKATVEQQGEDIKSQGQAITGLKQEIADKASSQALSELKSTVEQQGESIRINTEAITSLKGVVDGKADADALNSLKITVQEQGETLLTQGQAITSVRATADLALNGKKTLIDLTALDPNLYYPVFIPVSTTGISEIEISPKLGDFQAPWSTHYSGSYSLGVRWTTRGHGWGAEAIDRVIEKFGYLWADQSPAMEINQRGEDSKEYIYLRGGTIYPFVTNQFADTPYLESNPVGVAFDQSKVPQSVNARVGANASAISSLDSKINIVGDKVDVNAQAITGLQAEIKDKASSEALNQLSVTVRDQGQLIDTQGQAITKVESKVDNLKVGTGNLLRNSSFSESLDQWAWNGQVESADFIAEYGIPSGQSKYLKMRVSTGGSGYYQGVPFVKQGEEVIFSIWARGETGNEVLRLLWEGHEAFADHQLTTSWARYTLKTKPVINAPNVVIYTVNAGTFHISSAQYERGNIVSDWHPNSEDMASARAVSLLNTKIDNVDNKVNIQAQAITDLRSDLNNKANAQALNELSTTVQEQGETIQSQGKVLTSVEATANRTSSQLGTTVSYMLYTFRNGASSITKTGLYKADGTRLEGVSRGLNVYLFAANGDFVSLRFFDTYGDIDNACNNMVAYLSDLPQNSFIAIAGCDNLGAVSWPSGPPKALRDHLRDVWGVAQSSVDKWQYNDIPIVICRKWGPKNSAIDKLYTSSINGDWYSLGITFIDGIPNDWGGDTSKTNIEANASAISTMNADVIKNRDDIRVNAEAITGLSGRIDGKADAQALSQLQITVKEQGETISSQGQAITQVQASADMALNGKKYVVDLTALDPNLYYPVFIPVSSGSGISEISVTASLDEYKAPWSSHGSGTYSLNVRWRVRGSGWGANSIEREILRFGYAWCGDQSPVIEISQQGEQSREYIYLRGGTQYPFYVNQYAGQPFTDLGNYGGVPYRTDLMPVTINAATQANASAVSTLNAKVDIVDGKATSAAESVTKLQTSSTAATYQLLRDSNKIREKPVGSNPYPFYSAVYDKALVVGKTYTLVYEAEFQSGGANSFFRPYFSGTQHFSETNQSFGRQVFVVKAQLWAQNTDAINFYIVGSQPDQDNSYAKVYWACLYEEDQPNPIKVWMPNTRENSAKLEVQGQSIDGLMTKWSVKADVNGYVSGVAMNNNGREANFIIRADTFAIAPPVGSGGGDVPKYGFVYQASAKTLPNGTVIPAGLYVDNLMLGEINAEKINANSLSAISANLGTFTSSNAKGTMTISGTDISVKDTNGVERIFIGL
ncbi:putative tail fiber protein [Acinetobacter phage vB_AbaM_B09_Aci01-1]|uniref:Putative tail fiber protein n=1 Tax=Acinetobacter phage vB_AbaM_B09_Aci01-1 TaxID=2315466 RepID=A0A386KM25_9CAUD|nr:putative tail fiber protein [Acinetobacter phage vB_AbaM_B09_Aci01-1]AYD85523.1 putative tail fiber protein [Acinetobacter phage vB_AbaM_B09_Aci01-1]